MKTTRLILAGGFLGAGKTTLLWEAASRIVKQGQKVGLVTNDQAPGLVDTALLSRNEIKVAEVSGSCFCCNFNGLIDALKQVSTEADANIIIAEPVGSCTDLSATILQPLKKNLKGELIVSPFTVLADPNRLKAILSGGKTGLHPSAAYIFEKQLEESDIIVISKADLIDKNELELLKEKARLRFPCAEVMSISAVTGEGIEVWLGEVLSRNDAGKKIAEVDYETYAEGEAVLGWLNTTLALSGKAIDWDNFACSLMQSLSLQFDAMNAPVGHVKILVESESGFIAGNLVGTAESLSFRGSAGLGDSARMTLNARVEMTPKKLENIVRKTIEVISGNRITAQVLAHHCLSPGRPNPTYRFDRIAEG